MGNLIRFEIRKITRQKSLYICFGISLFLLLLNVILTKTMANRMEGMIEFSVVSLTVNTLSGASFTTLIGIFLALYCCDDASNNTLKNIYSRGYSRAKVFFAKYVVSLAVSVLVVVILFAVSFVSGKAFGAEDGVTGTFFGNLLLQILLVVGYHAVYFAISMMIGKVGGSIAINIIGPSLVFMILSLLATLMKIDFDFNGLWLDSVLTPLTQGVVESKMIAKSIGMPLAYTGIFVAAGYFVNRIKEV